MAPSPQRPWGRTSLRRSSSFFSSMLGTKSAPCTTLRTWGAHACASSRVMQEGHAMEMASARDAGSSACSLSLHNTEELPTSCRSILSHV